MVVFADAAVALPDGLEHVAGFEAEAGMEFFPNQELDAVLVDATGEAGGSDGEEHLVRQDE